MSWRSKGQVIGRGGGWTRPAASIAAVGCALGALAAPASAETLDVRTGQAPNSIQKAIDRADDGDTLRIHRGRYRETPVVDKRLTLVAAGRRKPLIDGECDTRHALEVVHEGVRLKRLRVTGADEGHGPSPAEVDFRLVESGKAKKLTVFPSCPGSEYGINVVNSERIAVLENKVRGGFTDGGIYVGAIDSTGGGVLRVSHNESYNNTRGLIVEFSEAAADIRVRKNRFHDNDAPGEGPGVGILVFDSDGSLFRLNRIRDNGAYGVHLTPGSEGHGFFDNRFSGNPQHVLDEGFGNCGSGNVPEVFPPC